MEEVTYIPEQRYPEPSSPLRFLVTKEKMSWSTPWPEYKPPEFTAPNVLKADWADPIDFTQLRFNSVDGNVNRKSFLGAYRSDDKGRPLVMLIVVI